MQRYPMTPQGHAALEEELKQLKTVDRPRITAAIAEAREHGDLKEITEPIFFSPPQIANYFPAIFKALAKTLSPRIIP